MARTIEHSDNFELLRSALSGTIKVLQDHFIDDLVEVLKDRYFGSPTTLARQLGKQGQLVPKRDSLTFDYPRLEFDWMVIQEAATISLKGEIDWLPKGLARKINGTSDLAEDGHEFKVKFVSEPNDSGTDEVRLIGCSLVSNSDYGAD